MIEVNALSKAYATTLFENIDLIFHDGTVNLITGANGCGKSTLLRCIAGLEQPDQGFCRVQGQLLYQPQQAMLFRLSAYDNAIIGNAKADTATVHAYFETFGMTELMSRSVAGFSGGERQKVVLIRSLLTGGDAMLLDEPFSALDAESSAIGLRLLRETARARQIPVVFISHDIEAGDAVADHRWHFENGSFSQIY